MQVFMASGKVYTTPIFKTTNSGYEMCRFIFVEYRFNGKRTIKNYFECIVWDKGLIKTAKRTVVKGNSLLIQGLWQSDLRKEEGFRTMQNHVVINSISLEIKSLNKDNNDGATLDPTLMSDMEILGGELEDDKDSD